MNENSSRTRNFTIIALLAVANAAQSWHLSNLHQQNRQALATLITANKALEISNVQTSELITNYAALIKKANKVGFAAALYGYEARRQGMETEPFVLQALQIFGTTNLPDVQIEMRTNQVELRDLTASRRL